MNKPIDLSSHPILQQAFDVIQAIEKCGASVELTSAVTEAGKLLQAINDLLAIRELKGDQVPVEYQMYYHNHGTGGGEWCRVRTKARYEELQIEHAGDNDFSFRTLFTATQKPVVLPEAYDDGHGNEWLPRGATIAAIEAAGGIVKDGE